MRAITSLCVKYGWRVVMIANTNDPGTSALDSAAALYAFANSNGTLPWLAFC